MTGTFWRRAVAETRRAEAAKLFALGRVELEDNPTAAIAYATASLELADVPEVRRFALEALYRGPTEFRLMDGRGFTTSFSPDGRWLAIGERGQVSLLAEKGGDTVFLPPEEGNQITQFIDRDRLLVDSGDHLSIWSVSQNQALEQLDVRGLGMQNIEWRLAGEQLIARSRDRRSLGPVRFHSVSLRDETATFLGEVEVRPERDASTSGQVWELQRVMSMFGTDPSGTRLIYPEGQSIYFRHLSDFQRRIQWAATRPPYGVPSTITIAEAIASPLSMSTGRSVSGPMPAI